MNQLEEVTLSMDLIHRLANKIGESPYNEVGKLLNELNVVVGKAHELWKTEHCANPFESE